MEDGFRKMATTYSKNTTFLLLIAFALLLDSNAVQGWGRLSEEEDLELDRQLQLTNKPAIKSFLTEYGDIVDCIDILKQPAFDHPLLKNHTIQMEPKTVPKRMEAEGSSQDVFLAYVANISCPSGSVPIRRTTKEDLIMEKHMKSDKYWHNSDVDSRGYHFAMLVSSGQIYGAEGRINIWNATVSADQFTMGNMQIVNGSGEQMNGIQAGWEVNQLNYSRLYIFWTADGGQKTGCFNLVCPGFVQVSSNITLGGALQPASIYDGQQNELAVTVYQDHTTRNWWFMFSDQYVGYWPREIFSSLVEGANSVSWGGEVYSPMTELSPAMGSGHFPEEGFRKSAFVRDINVLTDVTNPFVEPDNSTLKMNIDKPYCYNAHHDVLDLVLWRHHIYFGGPGNCTFD